MSESEKELTTPSADCIRIYKTWVPTVSGALSFSTLGSGGHPTRPIRANIGDHRVRYVIAIQKRDLLDSLVKFVAKRIYSGNFVCVCVGKSSDDPLTQHDVLVGRLAIYHDEKIWKRDYRPFIAEKLDLLRSFPSSQDTQNSLEKAFEDHFLNVKTFISESSSFFVDFRLNRNGVTTLTVPNHNNEYFPSDELERQHMERIVVSQAFFFLKDLSHNHQHHHRSLDTLVDVHLFTGNEIAWRSSILRFLYRKIIECKRDLRPEAYNSSLGILIYAKAFKKITEREIGKNVGILPDTDDDLLGESIRAGFQNSNHKQEQRENRRTNRLILFISGGTLLLTIVLLLTLTTFKIDHTKTDGLLVLIGCFLVKHTWIVVGLLFASYAVVTLRFKGKHDLADRYLIRYLVKWLQCFDQRLAGLIAIIIGIIMMLLTIFGAYRLAMSRNPDDLKGFFKTCNESRDDGCSCTSTTAIQVEAALAAKLEGEAALAAKVNLEGSFGKRTQKKSKQMTVYPCLTPRSLCFRPITTSGSCKDAAGDLYYSPSPKTPTANSSSPVTILLPIRFRGYCE
jgi:hypothetical protein